MWETSRRKTTKRAVCPATPVILGAVRVIPEVGEERGRELNIAVLQF